MDRKTCLQKRGNCFLRVLTDREIRDEEYKKDVKYSCLKNLGD